MPHSLLKHCQGACTLINLDGSRVSESKAEEALQGAKKAAIDWFGDDQIFSHWGNAPCTKDRNW